MTKEIKENLRFRSLLHDTCHMEGGERAGAYPWWGRGEGASPPPPPPPPLEIGTKMLSEEILTFSTYVLLMKLGGNRYTVQAT